MSLERRRCQLSSGPREENRGVGGSTRTTLRGVLDSRCRGSCVRSVNAEVLLDSILCLVKQYAILFWFCGAALVQTPCDSEVVCASLWSCGP